MAVVRQRGNDLALRLIDPRGHEVIAVDSPNAEHGRERLVAVATRTGRYRLEIMPAAAPLPAAYALAVAPAQPAGAATHARAEAWALLMHGQAVELAGDPQDATARVDDALRRFERLGALDDQAVARQIAGRVAWRSGRRDAAVAHYRRAHDLFRRLGDRREQARALYAIAEMQLDRPDLARPRLAAAAALVPADDPQLAGLIQVGLGLALRRAGDLRGAIRAQEEAIAMLERAGSVDDQAQAMINAAQFYLLLDMSGRARAMLGRAADLAIAAPWRRALLIRSWGDLARSEGDLDLALDRYQAALDTGSLTGVHRAALLSIQGLALVERGGGQALARAEDALVAARHGFDEAGREVDAAFVDVHRAKLFERRAQPVRAMHTLDGALAVFRRERSRSGLAAAYQGLARARRVAGDHAGAADSFEAALACIETLRGGAGADWLRDEVLDRWSAAYHEHVDLLLDRWRIGGDATLFARAVEVDEMRRARELVDRLGRRADAVRTPVSDARASEDACTVGPHRLASFDDIRAQLDADTVLLIWRLGPERGTVLWISPARADALDLGPRAPIEAQARLVRGLLVRPGHARALQPQLASLADSLLGPIADRLCGQRLLVVADGALRDLPFAALPAPGERGGAPLIAGHEVVHLPSASTAVLVRRLRPAPRESDPTVAIVADPVFDLGDERVPAAWRSAGDSATGRWPRLEASAHEARSIAERFPPDRVRLYLGFDARADRMRAGGIAQADIVHLAVHGELAPAGPELPRLVFARFDRRGRSDPRAFLSTADIYRLHLPAELVVLSACDSSRSRHGEAGLTSLAHAFFHAGAARLVGSLWRVGDGAAAKLMDRFYEGMIGRGLAPSTALAEAQRSLYAAGRPPADWASFVIEGDWRPLG